MGRWGGDGRRTIEQTRVIEIGTMRRAGFVGRHARDWWKWRWKANEQGIWPKSWRDGFIYLPSQTLCTEQVPWRFGGQRFYFVCECGRRVEKVTCIWRPTLALPGLPQPHLCGETSRAA
jgi:hypothetical protein